MQYFVHPASVGKQQTNIFCFGYNRPASSPKYITILYAIQTVMGDLTLSQFEASIKFDSDADLHYAGNTLRSGFGAHLRALVCATGGNERLRAEPDVPENGPEDCTGCPLASACVWNYFFGSSPPLETKVLRKQSDIPRPFVAEGQAAAASALLQGRDQIPWRLLQGGNGSAGAGQAHPCGQDGDIWKGAVRD